MFSFFLWNHQKACLMRRPVRRKFVLLRRRQLTFPIPASFGKSILRSPFFPHAVPKSWCFCITACSFCRKLLFKFHPLKVIFLPKTRSPSAVGDSWDPQSRWSHAFSRIVDAFSPAPNFVDMRAFSVISDFSSQVEFGASVFCGSVRGSLMRLHAGFSQLVLSALPATPRPRPWQLPVLFAKVDPPLPAFE